MGKITMAIFTNPQGIEKHTVQSTMEVVEGQPMEVNGNIPGRDPFVCPKNPGLGPRTIPILGF